MTSENVDPRLAQLKRAMSRRGFLAAAGATGAAAALAACGTGGSKSSSSSSAPATAAPVATPVDKSDSEKKLVWANWTLYLDYDKEKKVYPSLVEFEKQTGIQVEYKEDIEDNNTFNGKVSGQLSNGQDIGYDLVTPTDWLVAQWIRQGFVAKIDPANVPNKKNILPKLSNVEYDPGREYSLTWQSGFAGLVWNKEKVPNGLKTMEDLWNPELKGKVVVLSEMRDTVGLIMMSQGVDISGPFTNDQFMAALDVLQKQVDSGQIKQVKGNSYKEDLINGQAYAAIGWSGDIFQINAENGDKWGFALPESGGTLWSDNLLIPATATHKKNAEMLMNYYYQPTVAAQVAAYVNYICPVQGAQAEMQKLDPELAKSNWIFPDAATLDNSQVFRPLTPQEQAEYSKAFGNVIQG
ncbi:MAG TPA: spermidine/putrescine ABC transporter substrate-binding protein [Actinomycetota bacterium]|nr:spermidine/putrescine ABC transporter substrate-binding protein [Actinomycetota bacterium]